MKIRLGSKDAVTGTTGLAVAATPVMARAAGATSVTAGATAASTMMAAAAAGLMAAGCATSHKKELATHEVWTYSEAGKVTRHEVWSENHHGGGTALLADPVAAQIASYHTNQTGLGGASSFTVGNLQSTVNTNAAAIISSGGTAMGNVIGAAAGAK